MLFRPNLATGPRKSEPQFRKWTKTQEQGLVHAYLADDDGLCPTCGRRLHMEDFGQPANPIVLTFCDTCGVSATLDHPKE